MINEFYCVEYPNNKRYFFKNKETAFKELWQSYLDTYAGEVTDEELECARVSLNNYYTIVGFARIRVCGFVD